MFEKILIANRGEIAIRIIKTCRRMGIRTVAIYSEADSRSIHVRQADEAVFVGPARSEESYLAKEKIINTALESGCQAIHPGYGFLSENSDFASLTTQSGLTFIGPSAAAIAALGDKIASKNLAVKAGLPVIPGFNQPLSDMEEAQRLADQTGFPVLLKPAAGGGGRGMRVVYTKDELPRALAACREETRKAFGDTRIFLERFINNPRHIEVQILADQYGQIVHLGERECSIQRRHQKIIEESPSPVVDQTLRREMGRLACNLAKEAGYTNAGTVEFILAPEGNFYFLEMNTRLQVEHPVTEMVTALDLVELQLKVAAGERLPFQQEEITMRNWAIEARICAEDPSRRFMPTTGMINRYSVPRGQNIRVDSGIEAGSLVTFYYDSMLAKVIAWGENREEARKALVQALNGYHIGGIITNLDFVNSILNHPGFIQGQLSTNFLDEHYQNGLMKMDPPVEHLHSMCLAATLVYHNRQNLVRDSLKPMITKVGGVLHPKAWYEYRVKAEKDFFELRLHGDEVSRTWIIQVNEREYQVITPEFEYFRRRLKLEINGETHRFRLQYQGNFIWTAFSGITRIFEIYSPREWKLARYMPLLRKKGEENLLRCPMPGLVIDIRVKKGERIYRGQELVVIESMKMENNVPSPCDGEIEDIRVHPGQAVESRDVLLTFKRQ